MKKPAFDLKDIRIAVKTIKTAILRSRYMAARKANFEHLKLYFYVGAYVSANSRNGTWGTGAIAAISERLSQELPGLRGFSPSNIKNMRQFFEEWRGQSNRQLATGDLTKCLTDGDLPVIRQLSTGELTESDMAAFFSIGFTHHMEIIFKCRSQAERWYYIRKTAMEFWNVEDLKRRIRARDYAVNGKAINNFGLTIPSDRQVSRAVQAFKSEYLLDFVNIVDADDDEETMDEPEWMMEMVAKVRRFIQELGPDFCFMNVKKRFVVGESEFFSDLVFYHRTLKCMVAVELKKGAFKPAYLGQLDFYLACLDKYVKLEDENPSIGLILCHSMDRPVVELAVRRYSMPLGVATYRTSEDVPPAYKALKPLLDGSQKLLVEMTSGNSVSPRKSKMKKGGGK
jgi:predicted nuclease of restriction endonuclease-like (RecB) superfamily